MKRDESAVGQRPRHRFLGLPRRVAMFSVMALLVSTAATPVRADEYDPERAGHPLRILAYVLHPVGVAIDYLILRPAHWVVSREPMQTLFGHED